MCTEPTETIILQGFGTTRSERLPMLAQNTLNEAQRAAAESIIKGPRKAVRGPFIPLLQTPDLMEHVAKLGETLRFGGHLPAYARELAMCVVARETGNQFEWHTHVPLAIEAGVPATVLDSLCVGRRPHALHAEQIRVFDFVHELMNRNGVCDETYAELMSLFGKSGAVELVTLVGYFVMVCWVMNVARTPVASESGISPLQAFPQ